MPASTTATRELVVPRSMPTILLMRKGRRVRHEPVVGNHSMAPAERLLREDTHAIIACGGTGQGSGANRRGVGGTEVRLVRRHLRHLPALPGRQLVLELHFTAAIRHLVKPDAPDFAFVAEVDVPHAVGVSSSVPVS